LSEEGGKLKLFEKRILLSAILYSFCGFLFFATPLGVDGFRHKLLGTSSWAADNILNLGILEWGYRALTSHHPVFDWVAGYPLKNSLAGTENLLGWQWLYAPLRLMGIGAVTSYNLLMLLTFIIAGVGAALLARRHGLSLFVAFWVGFAFAFSPVRTANMVQIQSMAVCWVPWAFLGLEGFMESPTWRRGILTGVAICQTMLSGMYIGIFLLIAIGIWVAAGKQFPKWQLGLVLAGSISLLAPVLTHYTRFDREQGLTRGFGYMVHQSLDLLRLGRPSHGLWLWGYLFKSQTPFLGLAFIALVLVGVWKMTDALERRQFWTAIGLMLLACGPFLILNGNPIHFAGHAIPMPGFVLSVLPGIRVPARLSLVALLFATNLFGTGLTVILNRFGKMAGALVGACLLVEFWPAPWVAAKSVTLPEPNQMAKTYNLAGCSAIVELPTSPSTGGGSAETLSRYVYAAAAHLHPTVSYYASVWPQGIRALQQAAETLPDENAKKMLLKQGVNCLVVHEKIATLDELRRNYPHGGNDETFLLR
jgi:hypothetical protein